MTCVEWLCGARREDDDSAEGGGKPRMFKIPKLCTSLLSICKLLNQPLDDRMFYPRTYLGAAHEVFGLTMFFTWMMTFIFSPDQIIDHPARLIIGSYNPCFGWDYPPASYFALTLCSVNVFLTWCYAWLRQQRAALLNAAGLTRMQTFSKFASVFLAISSNTFLLLWVIGPNADQPGDDDAPNVPIWFVHTGIFVTYALASYLAVLSCYLEVRYSSMNDVIETKNTVFVIVYGVALGYLLLCYGYDLTMYEYGKPPAVKPTLTQLSDIVWMACVASITSFLPQEPPLRVHTEVVTSMTALESE